MNDLFAGLDLSAWERELPPPDEIAEKWAQAIADDPTVWDAEA